MDKEQVRLVRRFNWGRLRFLWCIQARARDGGWVAMRWQRPGESKHWMITLYGRARYAIWVAGKQAEQKPWRFKG